MLYVISFLVLFVAELCSSLHSLACAKERFQMAAITGAISCALWCVKIVVVANQPYTITTGFVGAYLGSLCAWKIEAKRKL